MNHKHEWNTDYDGALCVHPECDAELNLREIEVRLNATEGCEAETKEIIVNREEQFKLLRASCIKCGYIPFSGETQNIKYVEYVVHDRLELTCKRCKYSWEIYTLDKNDPPPLPEPPEPSVAIKGKE